MKNFHWAKIDVDLFDHPKVMGLKPADQNAFIQIVLYCAKQMNDGRIPVAAADQRWGKATMKRLVAARLVDAPNGNGTWEIAYQVHDYLDYQTAASEIEEISATKAEAGKRGAHVRRHVKEGRSDPNCGFCAEDAKGQNGPESRAHGNVVEGRF